MASPLALAAGAIVVLHLLFVLFVAVGAVLALRWRWMPWLHIPSALWAAYIEVSGGICPLTPLENDLRSRAGLDTYGGDFVARYFLPVLYPAGLTRDAQMLIGVLVVVANVLAYVGIYRRMRRSA